MSSAPRPKNNVPQSPGSQRPPEPIPVPDLSATIPQPSPRPSGDPADRVSGLTSIRDVRPEYSAIAKKLHVEGSVALKMIVMRDGRTSNVTVMRSLGYGLDEKAMQAAKQWLYIPRKKEGVPIMATLGVVEYFYLNAKTPEMWISGPMAFKLDNGITKPVIEDGERPNAITDLANTSVLLEFTVDSNGAVKDIQLINGSESLRPSLAYCLGTWRFQPARKGARALEALGRVRFIKGTGDENAGKPLFEGQARLTPH
jgi:TonB family protein